MNEGPKLPIIKHLEDKDDLRQGRDAELVPGQEAEAASMAEKIYEHSRSAGYSVLLFNVSPKRRAQETAALVQTHIERKGHMRVISAVNPQLREIDQGTFVLPEGYRAGDEFVGLKLAGQIFSTETFNPSDPARDNLLYRYGDPMALPDGSCRYPELVPYFSAPGEAYRDLLVRLYSEVLALSEKIDRIKDRAEPVVFTHGQPHQIFKDLAQVADGLEEGTLTFETGELPRLCWKLYQERRMGTVPYGKVDFVSMEHLDNPELISRLRDEIAYLIEL